MVRLIGGLAWWGKNNVVIMQGLTHTTTTQLKRLQRQKESFKPDAGVEPATLRWINRLCWR
jgi:hypothetical protein